MNGYDSIRYPPSSQEGFSRGPNSVVSRLILRMLGPESCSLFSPMFGRLTTVFRPLHKWRCYNRRTHRTARIVKELLRVHLARTELRLGRITGAD